jgi:hypothetical protein
MAALSGVRETSMAKNNATNTGCNLECSGTTTHNNATTRSVAVVRHYTCYCDATARVIATLRHCRCSSRYYNVATLWHYRCNSRCCHVATLWHYRCNSRCCHVTTLWRCSSRGRDAAALRVAVTLRCDTVALRVAAMLRMALLLFIYLF